MPLSSTITLTAGDAAIRIDRCSSGVVVDLEATAAADGKWKFTVEEFAKALGFKVTK
tara:strand:- start:1315 stop:1485 length:171 start_codon:yes stop_codon:yes gene_type:complete